MKTTQADELRSKMLDVAGDLLARINGSTPTGEALDLAHAVATLVDSATSPEYVMGSTLEIGERMPLDPPPDPGKRTFGDPPPDPGRK